LHGMGERGSDLNYVKIWGPLAYRAAGGTLSAYAAAPQCPKRSYWNHLLPDLNAWLDSILPEHPIDRDRVILTGFSMGGFGTCEWAYRNPDRFAAIVPVAGAVVPEGKKNPCALSTLPMWIIAGARDRAVPISGIDAFVNLIRSCGAEPDYTRYDDADHVETAKRAYFDTTIYDWMLSQSRSKS
jgi:predicted peptidase